MQVQQPARPPPPPRVRAYSKNAADVGVKGTIYQIINDKATKSEVIHTDECEQEISKHVVKETNGSTEA